MNHYIGIIGLTKTREWFLKSHIKLYVEKVEPALTTYRLAGSNV